MKTRKILMLTFFLIVMFCLLSVTGCGSEDPIPTPTPERIVYTVTFVQDGFDNRSFNVDPGADFTAIPEAEYEDGYIVKWEEKDLTNINEDITINAIKTPIEYDIAYILLDPRSYNEQYIDNSMNPAKYTIESGAELSDPVYPGYKFLGWTTTNNRVNKIVHSIPQGETGAKVLYAQWKSEYECSELTGKKKMITKYLGDDENVTIPEKINGFEIVEIGEGAFENNTTIKTLSLSTTLTGIDQDAFKKCTSLEKVTIPEDSNLAYIGPDAFYGCTALDNENGIYYADKWAVGRDEYLKCVDFRNDTYGIAAGLFGGLKTLSRVTIPAGIKIIGVSAFNDCPNLIEVYNLSDIELVAGDSYSEGKASQYARNVYTDESGHSNVFTDNNGFVFYADDELCYLIDYVGENPDAVLPQSFNGRTYNILAGAFACNKVIKSVTVPEGVTEIGFAAFKLSSIEKITLPTTLTKIDIDAFSYADSLEAVYISDIAPWCSIDFGEYTSANPLCYASDLYLNGELVVDLVIPDGVKKVSNYAFYQGVAGSNFRSLVLGKDVNFIGTGAFTGCSSIMKLTINNNSISVSAGAFSSCKIVEIQNLTTRVFTPGTNDLGGLLRNVLNVYTATEGETKIVTDEQGYVFYSDNTVCYLIGYIGSEIELNLPDDFNGRFYGIYRLAFAKNKSIKTVNIPDGVTEIGSSAFYRCSALESATIPGSVKKLSGGIFDACASLKSLTVLEGVEIISDIIDIECVSFEALYIPKTLKEICLWLSENYQPNLKAIYYSGTKEEWEQINRTGSFAEDDFNEKMVVFVNDLS